MKSICTLLMINMSLNLLAQITYADIEGRLTISLPEDETSIHIG